MGLSAIVACAGGLRIAQRGGGPVEEAERGADLCVTGPAPVAPPDTRPIEAQRRDHVVWRRHWPGDDRLVVDFVDVAWVEVDDRRGTVTFDRELPAEMEQHLLFDHVLPLVLARRGGVVLHGGVVSLDGQGVVLVGSSGAGKSTLTAYLGQRGWTVGGDDGAVLYADDPPSAEPTYPTVRLTIEAAGMLGIALEDTSAILGKRRVDQFRHPDGSAVLWPGRVRLSLVAIVEPESEAGVEPRFERLGGIDAHVELFGSTFHADLSAARRLPQVVEDLATIVERSRVGRLAVPRGVAGLAATEAVLRGLVAEAIASGDGERGL